MNYKLIGLSEQGSRVGETHPRAKLTDHDVDLIRELHEAGLSYRVIAIKFSVAKSTVRDIVKCRRRWQFVASWRRVAVDE
jgi:IS30 family transposase